MAGADFGNTIFEGAIAPSVEVQNPVEDKSGVYLAQAADSAAQGIGTVGGSIWKSNMENEANSVLVRYRQEAIQIADAMEQGLSPQAGRMRLRALYGDYLANNPGLAEDIDKLNSTILSENGIAHVIQTGSEEVQRQEKMADEAYGAGWGGDVDGYTNFLNATRALETQQKEITLRSAQLGYTTALDQQALKDGVNKWAQAGMPWVDQQIANASALIDGGADPATVVTQLRADIGKVVGDLTTNSGGMDIAHITGPIEKRLALFEDVASGKTTTEFMEAEMATIAAQQKYALVMSDPELSRLVAMSELFGAGASTFINNELTKRSVEIMGGLTRPYDPASDSNSKPENIIDSNGEVEASLDTMKELLTNAAANPTPERTQEVNNVLVNGLRALNTYNGESVKDYRSIINFFADPSVGQWVGQGGLVVPAEMLDKARKVIEAQYEDVLLPLVQEQWDAAEAAFMSVPGAGTTDEGEVSSFIEPYWSGSAVFFRAIGTESLPAIARQNIDFMVKNLNEGESSIAGPLNTLIRAKAHMNGTTDYTKEWEFFKDRLFPEAQEEGDAFVQELQSTVDGAQNISIGDFNNEQEAFYVQQDSAVTGSVLPPLTEEYITSSGIDFASYLPSIRTSESGGNDIAANPKSTAFGRYQFLRSTWDGLVAKYPDAGLTRDGRSNPEQQERAIRLFTAENARMLERNSIPLSNGSLYAAHFLGAADAVEVLAASDTDLVSDFVPPRVIRANPFLRGMTVARFKSWSNQKGNA